MVISQKAFSSFLSALKGVRLKIIPLEYVQASVVASFFRLKKSLIQYQCSAPQVLGTRISSKPKCQVAEIPSLETEVFGVIQCWRSFYLTVAGATIIKKILCCQGTFQISEGLV